MKKAAAAPYPIPRSTSSPWMRPRITGWSIANSDDQEILERCLYPLINIGADILHEGHALRASDIDLVYINGYGFPTRRGGPMHWAGTVGLKTVYEKVCAYHESPGL